MRVGCLSDRVEEMTRRAAETAQRAGATGNRADEQAHRVKKIMHRVPRACDQTAETTQQDPRIVQRAPATRRRVARTVHRELRMDHRVEQMRNRAERMPHRTQRIPTDAPIPGREHSRRSREPIRHDERSLVRERMCGIRDSFGCAHDARSRARLLNVPVVTSAPGEATRGAPSAPRGSQHARAGNRNAVRRRSSSGVAGRTGRMLTSLAPKLTRRLSTLEQLQPKCARAPSRAARSPLDRHRAASQLSRTRRRVTRRIPWAQQSCRTKSVCLLRTAERHERCDCSGAT
jgi:hypothetical protein